MKAKLVCESEIFKSKTLEQSKSDIQQISQNLADKITREEFSHQLGIGSGHSKKIRQGEDYILLTNEGDVLDIIEYFAWEYDQKGMVDLIDQAKKNDAEWLDIWLERQKTAKEYGLNFKPEEFEDHPISFQMLDLIFKPFIDKFKLEW